MDRKKLIYIGIVLIVSVIVSITYFSYAFFTRTDEFHGKLNIVAGTLNYKIESSDLNSNKQITLSANEIKEIEIKLTSLNDIDSKYEMYYTSTNNNVEVSYYDGMGTNKGTIQANKFIKLKLRIENKANSNNTVTFGVEGGFTSKTLVLGTGHKSLDSVIRSVNVTDNYVAYLSNGLNKNLDDLQLTGNTSSSTKVGQSGTINLVVSGKNLFDYRKITSKSNMQGITQVNNNNGCYTFSGSWNGTTTNIGYISYTHNQSLQIISRPGKYTFSLQGYQGASIPETVEPYFYVNHYYNGGNNTNDRYAISSHNKNNYSVYNFTSTVVNYADFWISPGFYIYTNENWTSTFKPGTYCPQIEYGDHTTSFEAYKEMRYAIALKNTSGTTINGLGSGDVLKKVNGKWLIQNGNTNTELHSSTQNTLNSILVYEGISNIWVDDNVLLGGISATYLKKEAISNN